MVRHAEDGHDLCHERSDRQHHTAEYRAAADVFVRCSSVFERVASVHDRLELSLSSETKHLRHLRPGRRAGAEQ